MSYGMDRLKNGIQHDHTNVDNRMSEDVQDIRENLKFYRKTNGRVELSEGYKH